MTDPPGHQATASGAVECQAYESYVRIRLNRPPVNAFTLGMLTELYGAVESLCDDTRPILIAGGGDVFSAGFDLKEQADIETASAHASRCLTAIQAHRSPVIAAVEGAAVGLGMLIATSADILVVSRTARLRMPEVTIGITSDVAPLRRYLPEPWIRRMCLLGQIFSAEELQLGRAGAILTDPGRAVEIATSLVDEMSRIDAEGLARTKLELHA